jgi:predicted AAA+ superfamily ATPase
VELNIERDPRIATCFVDNDPLATLKRLEIYAKTPIVPDNNTLLFIDEIQSAPALLAKLRWFAEEIPSLPVVAAGSLLDFALAEHAFSMPVGRISFLHLEPMGFEEFLLAMNEQRLAAFLAEEVIASRIAGGNSIPEVFHEKLLGLFREYLLVGGMPAAVARYRRERSLLSVAEIQNDLLATLRDDFGKYANRVHHSRLNSVLASVAQQLGSKFRYVRVDRHQRAAALHQAVELLCLARICHRVQASPAIGLPLGAGTAARPYKLILLDVGLVTTSLGISLVGLEDIEDLTLANKGAMAEQVVGQLLRLTFPSHREPMLFYWQRDERGSEAEVDYVIEHGSGVVPIEVKAGAAGTLKSLHGLMSERGWPLGVRLSSGPASLTPVSAMTTSGKTATYKLLSLPLYLVEQLPRLLSELSTGP